MGCDGMCRVFMDGHLYCNYIDNVLYLYCVGVNR